MKYIFRILAAIPALWASACLDATPPEPGNKERTQVLHRLVLPYEHVFMQVGDTVHLSAVAISLDSDTIPIPESTVEWISRDNRVLVDSFGRVTATNRTINPGSIIAVWKLNGVERRDTAFVNVFDQTFDIGSVRITPFDTARRGIDFVDPFSSLAMFDVSALDSDNQPVADIILTVPNVTATYNLPGISGVMPMGGSIWGIFIERWAGELWIRTGGWFFGNVLTDSLKFTALYPARIQVEFSTLPQNNVIVHDIPFTHLQPCGTVEFRNNTQEEIIILFDRETSGVECGGSVPLSGSLTVLPGQTAQRVMSSLGEFDWHARLASNNSEIRGVRGKLTVKDVISGDGEDEL